MKRPIAQLLVILSLSVFCCDTDEATIPVVTTSDVSSVTYFTAVGGGAVTNDGGSEITQRGICWSTAESPTIEDDFSIESGTTGSFSSTVSQLTPNTMYHVRAYASNGTGTAYGETKSFTTLALELPSLTTSSVTNITFTTATSGGNITDDGGSSITARGIVWNTQPEPTTSHSKTTSGQGTGTFQSNLTDLLAGTTYYVRAYATSEVGTAYGSQQTLTTPAGTAPSVELVQGSEITRTTIKIFASVLSDGGLPVLERGVCWIKPANGDLSTVPTINSDKSLATAGSGEFTAEATNLEQMTMYRVRPFVRTAFGVSYGQADNVTTRGPLYEGIYEVVAGSIERNSATGPDPTLSGNYTIGQEIELMKTGTYTVLFTPLWKDGTVISGVEGTIIQVNEGITLAGGAHPAAVTSSTNPLLTNTPGTENKLTPGTPDFPGSPNLQEFTLNFSWGVAPTTRVVTNFRIRYKRPRN
jgi:hypothetical protein